MARGFFRKTSFWKTVGAFRSQWKRALKRFFLWGYGKKGMGWWRDPKKAFYNWWYYRTSVSIPRLLAFFRTFIHPPFLRRTTGSRMRPDNHPWNSSCRIHSRSFRSGEHPRTHTPILPYQSSLSGYLSRMIIRYISHRLY